MPAQYKIEMVEKTADRMRSAIAIFFTDYKGISAEKDTELRALLRENDVDYRVVKKTLAKLAAKEVGLDEIDTFIEGQMAMAFTDEDPAQPAKILQKFSKDNDGVPAITGIVFEGQVLPAAKAQEIADLPSREEIIAKIASAINQPMTMLASTLNGAMSKLAQVLGTLKDQKTS